MALLWIVFAIFAFMYLLQNLSGKKKNLPPGPTGIPIIGHFHLLGKNPHQDLCKLAQKHGPVMYMRFGMVPTIIVSSPAAAELVLKRHDNVFASRPPMEFAKYLAYGQRDVALAPYGPYWRDMRKLCFMELMSSHKINQFRDRRKEELGLLVETVRRAADRFETVNVSARIMDLTQDMITLMVFGKKFADSDFDDQKGCKAVTLEVLELAGSFNLGDYFPFLGAVDLQGLTCRMKNVSKIFDKFLEKTIDDHVCSMGGGKEVQDFVDTLMEIMASGNAGFEFDRRHVKAILVDMIIGGMDSSAMTVDWAITELVRHPREMKKLQNELEAVFGKDHMVEESNLHKVEYLDFVLRETLRLHPIGSLLVPHESMEDCTIFGFHIPKKSRVLVNVWAIGRDPNVWPNPEAFSPERFIGSRIDLKGHDFELIPFGSGRRICPGLELGLTMVKFALAQLVHCFDWELPNGMLPSDLDMSEHFGLTVSRAKNLMAIPKYRLCK